MKDLEIYVHIPFCVRKCAYCDFLSFPADREVQETYVNRLTEEIRGFSDTQNRRVTTVFFGGGTPSLLPAEEVERIALALREHFPHWGNGAPPEFTMECNPGTLTEENLVRYRACGVNRLSIGLQSAQNAELAALGRIHTYEDFVESYALARQSGFTNINVDLMWGLPGQTTAGFRDTLTKVCALAPEHVSAYSLMLEEGTPFFERYQEDERRRAAGEVPSCLPTEEEERAMCEEAARMLTAAGYQPYEISNYAKSGRRCRHNVGYWRRSDYVGFGLGASSLLDPLRRRNTDRLQDYLRGDFSGEDVCVLTEKNRMEETMFLGLRMTEGVSLAAFEQTFSRPMKTVYAEVIPRLLAQGFLEEREGFVRLTKRGFTFSNRVLAEFLLDE